MCFVPLDQLIITAMTRRRINSCHPVIVDYIKFYIGSKSSRVFTELDITDHNSINMFFSLTWKSCGDLLCLLLGMLISTLVSYWNLTVDNAC